MATTATEARGKVCLMALVNANENPFETCRPGECSAWAWGEACNASGIRLGHCILAGEAAWTAQKTEKPARARRK